MILVINVVYLQDDVILCYILLCTRVHNKKIKYVGNRFYIFKHDEDRI